MYIYFHGGAWTQLSGKDSSFMATTFAEKGVSVAAVNYSLLANKARPEVTMDMIVAQCRRSVAWIHQNAETYGLHLLVREGSLLVRDRSLLVRDGSLISKFLASYPVSSLSSI